MARLPGIVLFGMNHKTAALEVREKLSLNADEVASVLLNLKMAGTISELLILSTCNRVEFLLVTPDTDEARKEVLAELALRKGVAPEFFASCFYLFEGLEAVRHLFRVSASLDSMVLGEPQILGQVKQAYQRSTAAGASGPILNRLMHRAFQVAKRIRTETGIGDHAVSISYAAIELARKIFGSLEGRKAMLLGAGEMAELAVEHLLRHRISEVIVANRTFDRGFALAQRFGGKAIRFDDVQATLGDVDIVISSTGASDYVIRKADIRPLMRKRQNRSLFFIDIAVPRDVDPAINSLDNAYVYDIDDLQGVVDDNLHERQQEASRAEGIIEEAVLRFAEWVEGLALVPTIKALREKVGTILEDELRRTLGDAGLPSEAMDRMVESMVTKILHDPISLLKSGGMHGNRDRYLGWVRLLFCLDPVESEGRSVPSVDCFLHREGEACVCKQKTGWKRCF
ncbi:glutamyl-tRNA reductase [Desulfobotulus sp. H1]|uniref:Glutamyl-tRNA reductase n=1 Tax=Desulfobotulus pelophilus TaxID=2823377 RepID=A0ABT3NAV6_9BACT|nr:glutamyl-tRNA reductase [Desulfobotulus pelophilus]MCW7754600.1 glutamyl-tRNA reductase [Desulfobotulus pelophilus]